MTEHDDAALGDLLDLDGEVLHAYWADALAWVMREGTTGGWRRIVDLGAGTGTATIALAQQVGGADVVAVDASEPMLERIRAKTLDLGLADRIRTVRADLDDGWPALGTVDLTWASMSMHHFAAPDRVLAQVAGATRPGGLVAVAEFSAPLRFLPDDLGVGRPGLELRCLEILAAEHAHSLPDLGSAWAPRLEAAGLTVLDERTFTIDLRPPPSSTAARYAQLWWQRLRVGLAHHLSDDDRDTLDALVEGAGPESILRRDDLHLHGSRTVTVARRP